MPTDAEWEFAARGGNQSHGYTYSGGNDPNVVGWHNGNSGGAPCGNTWPVGQKAANELGLYDMSGNVWEWGFDWYPGYEGSFRGHQGGSWDHSETYFNVGARYGGYYPYGRFAGIGFRLACNAGQ